MDGRRRFQLLQSGLADDGSQALFDDPLLVDAPRPSGFRKAADALFDPNNFVGWGGPVGRQMLRPRGIALGGGLAALSGLLAAGQELNNPDPTRSSLQNAAAAAGSGLGTTGGAVVGGILGGMTPLGPVGALIGSSLGAALAGTAGKGLADMVTGFMEPSAEEKALNSFKKQNAAALASEIQRAEALMPIQQKAAEIALGNDLKRARVEAELRGQDQIRQNLAQAFLQQQMAGAQQSLATTQGIFSRLS